MNLEPIIGSEVSQKKKYKYCILMYVWNLERWYYWIYFQEINGETDIDIIPMDKWEGEEGEGQIYEENNIDTYNTMSRIDSQWEFAV